MGVRVLSAFTHSGSELIHCLLCECTLTITHTHKHTSVQTHAHTNTYAHNDTRTQTRTHINTRAHKHIRTQIHAHTSPRAQTQTHTHTQLHAIAHARSQSHRTKSGCVCVFARMQCNTCAHCVYKSMVLNDRTLTITPVFCVYGIHRENIEPAKKLRGSLCPFSKLLRYWYLFKDTSAAMEKC